MHNDESFDTLIHIQRMLTAHCRTCTTHRVYTRIRFRKFNLFTSFFFLLDAFLFQTAEHRHTQTRKNASSHSFHHHHQTQIIIIVHLFVAFEETKNGHCEQQQQKQNQKQWEPYARRCSNFCIWNCFLYSFGNSNTISTQYSLRSESIILCVLNPIKSNSFINLM